MTTVVLASAVRILFLVASAPVMGSALLTLIAVLTGADWPAGRRAGSWLPVVAIGAVVMGVVQIATPPPPHLALWLHPVAVAARAVAVPAALWLAIGRLGAGRSPTSAGITLALYAVVVTPIASDWMLGQVPSHTVSAAGMMLVCQQVAAATALPLAFGWGGERERQDLAKLMVAAGLGLGYLIFMDYLIVWFGNLPAHVGFYSERGGLAAIAALLLGWAVPIALLATGAPRLRRHAGVAVLAASFVADAWWVGGGVLAAALALLVVGMTVAGSRMLEVRR
jgi:hypothetical protein